MVQRMPALHERPACRDFLPEACLTVPFDFLHLSLKLLALSDPPGLRSPPDIDFLASWVQFAVIVLIFSSLRYPLALVPFLVIVGMATVVSHYVMMPG